MSIQPQVQAQKVNRISGKNSRRSNEPLRYVKDPATGDTHEMTLSNAFDVVNTRGWQFVGKVRLTSDEINPGNSESGALVPSSNDIVTGNVPFLAAEREAKRDERIANGEAPSPADLQADAVAARNAAAQDAIDSLNGLRAEAAKLGIEVKQNYGTKKLQELIDSKAKVA